METFFKTIKAELIWRHSWQTRRAVEVAIFEYINGFYNPRRRHSALGWKSPFSWFVSQTTAGNDRALEQSEGSALDVLAQPETDDYQTRRLSL